MDRIPSWEQGAFPRLLPPHSNPSPCIWLEHSQKTGCDGIPEYLPALQPRQSPSPQDQTSTHSIHRRWTPQWSPLEGQTGRISPSLDESDADNKQPSFDSPSRWKGPSHFPSTSHSCSCTESSESSHHCSWVSSSTRDREHDWYRTNCDTSDTPQSWLPCRIHSCKHRGSFS